MSQYRAIDYPKMLYETLRNYFSINAAGELSYLFKILLSCLWPLKISWDSFVTYRNNKLIIANTKYQVGQLINVLNYLYDPTLKRIYISQAVKALTYVPSINYESTVFAPSITYESTIQLSSITNSYNVLTAVSFCVPSDVYNTSLSQITSTIEQIRILGLTYQITSV